MKKRKKEIKVEIESKLVSKKKELVIYYEGESNKRSREAIKLINDEVEKLNSLIFSKADSISKIKMHLRKVFFNLDCNLLSTIDILFDNIITDNLNFLSQETYEVFATRLLEFIENKTESSDENNYKLVKIYSKALFINAYYIRKDLKMKSVFETVFGKLNSLLSEFLKQINILNNSNINQYPFLFKLFGEIKKSYQTSKEETEDNDIKKEIEIELNFLKKDSRSYLKRKLINSFELSCLIFSFNQINLKSNACKELISTLNDLYSVHIMTIPIIEFKSMFLFYSFNNKLISKENFELALILIVKNVKKFNLNDTLMLINEVKYLQNELNELKEELSITLEVLERYLNSLQIEILKKRTEKISEKELKEALDEILTENKEVKYKKLI